MRVMRIDTVAFIRLGDKGIYIIMTFCTHLIAEMTFGRRVIKIIRYIPDCLMNLVLNAVLMTVDTIHMGSFMSGGQQLSVVIALYIGIHHMAGRTGQFGKPFYLMHDDSAKQPQQNDSGYGKQRMPGYKLCSFF